MRKLSNLFRISTFAFVIALMASCAEDAAMDELIQDIEKYDVSATDGDPSNDDEKTQPPTTN